MLTSYTAEMLKNEIKNNVNKIRLIFSDNTNFELSSFTVNESHDPTGKKYTLLYTTEDVDIGSAKILTTIILKSATNDYIKKVLTNYNLERKFNFSFEVIITYV